MSKWSRQTYEATAAIIEKQPIKVHQQIVLAVDFSNLFAEDNPAFNRLKFYTACGIRFEEAIKLSGNTV